MPDSPDDKTSFTPAPSRGGDARPASSRAGSSGLGWSPPSVEHLQQMLPQYEILSVLGHGGMGAVYKGKQISLDRMVAIKILPPGLDDDDAKFTERFKNEARTMARMNHPGIVSVYDFGETAEGQFYFVMEYVDGTDVAKMIQSSVKLPPDHALAITAHVCDALGYAHANGVIHRDIKPANILINMQGQVKVADFGLAKQDDPSMTSGLTKTGMAMGTPDFVAPEALIMGVNVDGRADLYAIGVMLYQMLTGDIPRGLFLMPSVKTNGEIDPRFDRIITRAMQTDREERYQKASEIRKDLDVILTAPRVKQDASKAVAAVPQGAVKNVPGQRSAAQKPMPKGPGQPGAKKDQPAPAPHLKPQSSASESKSKTGLYIGIAAGIAVIGGAAFMFSGGKPDVARPSKVENSPATGSTLESRATSIKVAEPSKPTAGSQAASTTSDGWIDGLAEWIAKPGNVSSGIMKEEAGVWRISKGESVRFGPTTPGSFLANVAVRVTIRDMGNKHFGINLRGQGSAKGGHQAGFESSGRTGIFLETEGAKRTELGSFQTPAGFVVGPRHVMEFRAEGDVLTTIVDGQTTGSVKDATFSSGRISITGLGVLIEKIEYRDLGTSPATPIATATTSDGWIDGLAEWLAVPGNVKSGNLKAEAGAWRHAGSAAIALGTHLPGRSLANLAVRVTVREMMSNGVVIHLRDDAKTKRQYGVSLGKKFGITQVTLNTDGKTEQLASFEAPAGFNPEARHTLEFRAEGELLTVLVDGQQTGSIKDATLATGRMEVNSMSGLIEEIEYRDLGNAPIVEPAMGSDTKSAGSQAASTTSDGWIDGLAEWLAVPANAAQSTLQKEGTAWRYKGPQAIGLGARLSPPNTLANVAVRYSVRLDNKNSSAYIQLRTQKAAASFYQVTVYGSGVAGMALVKDGQLTELAHSPKLAGFDETATHVIEFRAEGDKLTLLVDGVERGSVNDSNYASGGFSVARGLIDKIEYRDLGTSPAMPVVAGTGSDGWTDGLAEWLALPGNATKSTLQKEADGWRYKGPQSIGLGARLSPPYQLANVAVRLTSKGGGGSIGLRSQGGAGNHYLAVQSYPNFVEIRRGQNNEYTTLAKFKLPPGFKQGDSYVMEFRAEGEVLTLMVNGQTLGSIKDSTYSSGKFHVSPLYALIEKLEYCELPATPPSATSNSSATIPVATPPAAVSTPPDTKLAALLPNYTKAITAGLAAASATDKPAFEAELARMKNNAPLPDAAGDAKLPAELKRLRGILREQLK